MPCHGRRGLPNFTPDTSLFCLAVPNLGSNQLRRGFERRCLIVRAPFANSEMLTPGQAGMYKGHAFHFPLSPSTRHPSSSFVHMLSNRTVYFSEKRPRTVAMRLSLTPQSCSLWSEPRHR